MTIPEVKQWLDGEVKQGFLDSYYFYKHDNKGLVFVGVTDQGEVVMFEQYPEE